MSSQSRRVALVPGLASAGVVQAGLALPLSVSAQSSWVGRDQARAQLEAGKALRVDIREPNEHATGVAPGARHLPMPLLSTGLAELPRDRPARLICNSQNRSHASFDALRERSWTNLRCVNGGISDWNCRGWKTVKPGG